MIAFFESGSWPIIFQPSALKMVCPNQREAALPLRGVEGWTCGLSNFAIIVD